jgi:hypothetical protein
MASLVREFLEDRRRRAVAEREGDPGSDLGVRGVERRRGAVRRHRRDHVGRVAGGQEGDEVCEFTLVEPVDRRGRARQLDRVAACTGEVEAAPVDSLLPDAFGRTVQAESPQDRRDPDIDRDGLEVTVVSAREQHIPDALHATAGDVDDLGVEDVPHEEQLVVGERDQTVTNRDRFRSGAEVDDRVLEGGHVAPRDEVLDAPRPDRERVDLGMVGADAHGQIEDPAQRPRLGGVDLLAGLDRQSKHAVRVCHASRAARS